jgi:23S rRNA pseudouridine2605 synthase
MNTGFVKRQSLKGLAFLVILPAIAIRFIQDTETYIRRKREMNSQPILKTLTGSGLGSRRQMAAIIKRGGVTLNGKVVESFNEPVDPAKDVITIDGKPALLKAAPAVYIMLNKPQGIVSTTRGEGDEKTVLDMLPEKYGQLRLYPVGRLDKDSTGLVLLTNDGNLTYQLTHPRFEQEKEYLVRIEGNLKPGEITRLERGILLEEGMTSPARVKTSKYPPFNYSVTIHEGKKRQIRRMFAALGYMVLDLKRISFGNLRLGNLPEGQTRELTLLEIKGIAAKDNRDSERKSL